MTQAIEQLRARRADGENSRRESGEGFSAADLTGVEVLTISSLVSISYHPPKSTPRIELALGVSIEYPYPFSSPHPPHCNSPKRLFKAAHDVQGRTAHAEIFDIAGKKSARV